MKLEQTVMRLRQCKWSKSAYKTFVRISTNCSSEETNCTTRAGLVLLCFEKKLLLLCCENKQLWNKAAECLVNFFVKVLLKKKSSIIVFGKLLCKTDVKKSRFFKAGFCSFLFLAFFHPKLWKKSWSWMFTKHKKAPSFFWYQLFSESPQYQTRAKSFTRTH